MSDEMKPVVNVEPADVAQEEQKTPVVEETVETVAEKVEEVVEEVAEEAVEGLFAVGKAGGNIKTVLWYGKVFVDVDGAVSPLVPHFAGR